MSADISVHDRPAIHHGFRIQTYRGHGTHHIDHRPSSLSNGAETPPARRASLDTSGNTGFAGTAGQRHRAEAKEILFIDAAHLVKTRLRVKFQVLKTAFHRAATGLFFPDDWAGVTNASLR